MDVYCLLSRLGDFPIRSVLLPWTAIAAILLLTNTRLLTTSGSIGYVEVELVLSSELAMVQICQPDFLYRLNLEYSTAPPHRDAIMNHMSVDHYELATLCNACSDARISHVAVNDQDQVLPDIVGWCTVAALLCATTSPNTRCRLLLSTNYCK
ncbi:hypothetical protein WAI453_005081 [Rhynchosporium graminicola]